MASYIGEPYGAGSRRSARIYTSMTSATRAAKRYKGKEVGIYQVGKGKPKMYVIKKKGSKYYSR